MVWREKLASERVDTTHWLNPDLRTAFWMYRFIRSGGSMDTNNLEERVNDGK
jgi:hypothetical protein